MKERKGSSATDDYEPWSLDLGHSSDYQNKAPLSLAISFLLATQTTGRTEGRSATKEGRRRSMEALRASYGSLSEDSDDDSSLEKQEEGSIGSIKLVRSMITSSFDQDFGVLHKSKILSNNLQEKQRGSPSRNFTKQLVSSNNKLWIGNFMAYNFCRKDKRPLKLHPELEKLLKEEFRSLDDFRAKSKATKDFTYSAIGASKDETDNSDSPALAEAVATSSLKLG
ncbi:La-related protein 1A [Nymphaea thermarum]|nr:La-related protein 1A [Nymphaea thermarum]